MEKAYAKAPGKLFIAGEYAVVTAYQPSVIVAVNRFISVSVSPTTADYGTIQSKVLSDDVITWRRTDSGLVFSTPSKQLAIIKATMDIVNTYLADLCKPLAYYDMVIESEMVNDDGVKYGLGSSGAVTVAIIDAVMKAHSISLSSLKLYKLASLAHLSLNSNGSFGDLAAASFTGWIAYSRFNQDSLEPLLQTHSITQLINQPWEGLTITPLPSPKDLTLLVGWTGSPASTESLVSQSKKTINEAAYTDFLQKSKECVHRLIQAIQTQNSKDIMRAVNLNRELLLEMAELKSIELETPLLASLCKIAHEHLAAAKTSGAGGGDCGIALLPKLLDSRLLESDWESAGITPLNLTVYQK